MTIGVLALQGAFRAHRHKLDELGVDSAEIRLPEHLDDVDALIVPGGESTTMSMLLESSGLFDPVAERLTAGMPVFGTCAGLILLSKSIEDGRADQRNFGVLDVTVKRNGYGRQVASFEDELTVCGVDEPVHAVFIRAPQIVHVGDALEVLASDHRGDPVLVRHGHILGCCFHPELSEDHAIHRLFVESTAY